MFKTDWISWFTPELRKKILETPLYKRAPVGETVRWAFAITGDAPPTERWVCMAIFSGAIATLGTLAQRCEHTVAEKIFDKWQRRVDRLAQTGWPGSMPSV